MTKQLIALLVAICLTGTSQAAMIATPADRNHLLGVLERVEVQQQLQAQGVSVELAKARVAALSDAEAAQLAAQIDSLPAGGDGVGALIGAILIVFLVLLITDILGFTKVFPFTKPIK
ncbi:MAG: hypothetical protein QOD26_4116 [Betaproteobacteria bacterium]|nr:hypothetical protein [Betaproteobacteria bacterium]